MTETSYLFRGVRSANNEIIESFISRMSRSARIGYTKTRTGELSSLAK
jgi:hypothetical protein